MGGTWLWCPTLSAATWLGSSLGEWSLLLSLEPHFHVWPCGSTPLAAVAAHSMSLRSMVVSLRHCLNTLMRTLVLSCGVFLTSLALCTNVCRHPSSLGLDPKGPAPWLKLFQNAREWCEKWDQINGHVADLSRAGTWVEHPFVCGQDIEWVEFFHCFYCECCPCCVNVPMILNYWALHLWSSWWTCSPAGWALSWDLQSSFYKCQPPRMIRNQLSLSRSFMSALSPHTFLIVNLRSAFKSEYQMGAPARKLVRMSRPSYPKVRLQV